jgi:hypothetical protein
VWWPGTTDETCSEERWRASLNSINTTLAKVGWDGVQPCRASSSAAATADMLATKSKCNEVLVVWALRQEGA